MMMGFGLLIMLAVLALPILLTFGLVVWMKRQSIHQNSPQAAAVNPPVVVRLPIAAPAPSSGAPRVCAHCGAGLQSEWTHCPQCGAPVG